LPILRGNEVMIEAEFGGARGHAFTSQPGNWSGSLREVLVLPLQSHVERAILCATMNAVLRFLGEVGRTVHCKSEDIEDCGREMAEELHAEFGDASVGVVGYQPGLVAGLVSQFGPARVHVTDLAAENVGQVKQGVEMWDGATRTGDLVAASDLVLATGSTAANGTYDEIARLASKQGVPLILFGVTAAAVCHLCGIRRMCLRAT
jgi:uncharacterized protein (DUF4213/DUF364 family)